MKHIMAGEQSLLVGDEAADLLLVYAALIAQLGRGDTVDLRAIDAEGGDVTFGFLLNSATSLLVKSSPASVLPEPDNEVAVVYMRSRMDHYRAVAVGPTPFDALDDEQV